MWAPLVWLDPLRRVPLPPGLPSPVKEQPVRCWLAPGPQLAQEAPEAVFLLLICQRSVTEPGTQQVLVCLPGELR